MLSKEILNDITIDELRNVCRKWHEIDNICNATPDGYKQFDITQECDGYTDRYRQPENGEKEIKYIENPLPLPKKHEKKSMGYKFEVQSAEK